MTTYAEALTEVRAVEEAGNPSKFPTCFICGHIGFHYPAPKASDPGHVYSDLGMEEWKNTGICEFCFDKTTADPSLTPADQEAERLQAIEAFKLEQFREAMRGLY